MADILFVSPNLVQSVKSETNGIMILGTILLHNGFDVDILRYSEAKGYLKDYSVFVQDLADRIVQKHPRIVSLYTITTNIHASVRVAEEVKRQDSSIVVAFGGPYSSLLPREILDCAPCVDYVCAGEGENTIIPFVRHVLDHNLTELYKIPGLNYRLDGQIISNPLPDLMQDLDSVPMWDERLLMEHYDEDPDHIMGIEVGRGCPFRCAFCSTSIFWERNYRLKSPKRVIEDIKYFHERFAFPLYSLSHDALTANNKMMEQLCDELIKADLGVNLVCSSRADCLTPELIEKMQRAGFVEVQMGVETGSERMQKLVNKNLDLSKVKETVKCLIKHNIAPQIYFIYGFPDETREELNDTLNLIFDLMDLGATDISIRRYKFSPKTKLCEKYYDDIYCDEELLKREVRYFGLYEERDMIRANKKMFSNLYNMHTEVRDQFLSVNHLINLYRLFPKKTHRIRALYHYDCTKLYDDLMKKNPALCALPRSKFIKRIEVQYAPIMLHTIRDIKSVKAVFVRSALRFDIFKRKLRSKLAKTVLGKIYRRLF